MLRNGPGKSYRKTITLAQMSQMFPNNDIAREWFEEAPGRKSDPGLLPLLWFVRKDLGCTFG